MSMWTSFRSEFVGTHVTPQVKLALEQAAKASGQSVSLFVYRLIKRELKVKDEEKTL